MTTTISTLTAGPMNTQPVVKISLSFTSIIGIIAPILTVLAVKIAVTLRLIGCGLWAQYFYCAACVAVALGAPRMKGESKRTDRQE